MDLTPLPDYGIPLTPLICPSCFWCIWKKKEKRNFYLFIIIPF